MIVRAEATGDAAGIRHLVEAAFGGVEEANLVDALRTDGHAAISLVAEEAGEIVGHVLLSPLRRPERCLALAPLCVLPGRQRRGIGSRLVRAGLDEARDAGWRAVFVVGAPDYYGRFGFDVSAASAFETPYPREYFMAAELEPRALADKSGPVVHAPPFERLG